MEMVWSGDLGIWGHVHYNTINDGGHSRAVHKHTDKSHMCMHTAQCSTLWIDYLLDNWKVTECAHGAQASQMMLTPVIIGEVGGTGGDDGSEESSGKARLRSFSLYRGFSYSSKK